MFTWTNLNSCKIAISLMEDLGQSPFRANEC